MPSWQITELACVHEYLIDRLDYIFDEIENRFVAHVLEEKARATSSKKARSEDSCHGAHADSGSNCELCRSCGSQSMSESASESMGDSNSDIESDNEFSLPTGPRHDRFEEEDLFFAIYTKTSWHQIYMEYIISLGLELFHDLLLANNDKRSQIVVASGHYGGDFLARSFVTQSRNYRVVENITADQKDEIPEGYSLQFLGDKLSAPILAWLWSFDFKQYLLRAAVNNSLQSCFLRSWGYVFWDAVRIQSSHILNGT